MSKDKRFIESGSKEGKGRTPKLAQPLVRKQIQQLARKGLHDIDICMRAGIKPDVFSNWKNRGEREFAIGKDSIYSRFYIMLSNARSTHVEKIFDDLNTSSADGNERASIRLLDNYPQYRVQQELNITITQEIAQQLPSDVIQEALRTGDMTKVAVYLQQVKGLLPPPK